MWLKSMKLSVFSLLCRLEFGFAAKILSSSPFCKSVPEILYVIIQSLLFFVYSFIHQPCSGHCVTSEGTSFLGFKFQLYDVPAG